MKVDILIAGGGVGGVAAALAALSAGCRVVMTEEYSWLGGQLTTQFVPPDEHRWIEAFGRTARYAALREKIRAYYRAYFPLTAEAAGDPRLNPGRSTVSRISHLPSVSCAVIRDALAPYLASGQLKVFLETVPVAVERNGEKIQAVTFLDKTSNTHREIRAAMVLDATELGDLLPLAEVPYRSGAESRQETGEPHAIDGPAEPDNVQAITWCLPLAYDPDCHEPREEYAMPQPKQYRYWRDYVPETMPPWPGKLLGWEYWVGWKVTGHLFRPPQDRSERDLWTYRRIFSQEVSRTPVHEVTVVNWWHNDFYEENIIDRAPEEKARLLEAAGQQSLSLAWWLQNEAPRPDGGVGYPGLYLRPDLTGRADGLAPAPYIRESRRIKAWVTVTENEIGVMAREGRPPEPVAESCGIGSYGMDIHPTRHETMQREVGWAETFPFQIPLGALIPIGASNLLAAAKNIGTTHLTNGCYRLHPVEWNIGEAAGALAAYCVQRGCEPAAVRTRPEWLAEFQARLVADGVELEWPQPFRRLI